MLPIKYANQAMPNRIHRIMAATLFPATKTYIEIASRGTTTIARMPIKAPRTTLEEIMALDA